MNTGTPMSDSDCAMVCKVTVLPVPVAPVMQPCRLTRFDSMSMMTAGLAVMFFAIGSEVGMSSSRKGECKFYTKKGPVEGPVQTI